MFGDWPILNVVISLFAVYTAFSLVASYINEQVATFLNLRSKTLVDGVYKMVDDAALHRSLFAHPAITTAKSRSGKLSYISAQQFTTALIGTITAGRIVTTGVNTAFGVVSQQIAALPNQLRIKAVLSALVNEADGDYQRLLNGISNWFDDHMDRVSGWYRRTTNWWLLGISLIVAFSLNVDTINLLHIFSAKPLTISAAASPDPNGTASPSMQDLTSQVLSQITLGWSGTTWCPDQLDQAGNPIDCTPGSRALFVVIKIFGLLITALALTLGAPFWFDALQKVTNVRNSGVKPQPDQPAMTK